MSNPIPHNTPNEDPVQDQADDLVFGAYQAEDLVLIEPEDVATYQVNYLDGTTVIRVQLKPTEDNPEGEVLEMEQPMGPEAQSHMAQPAAIFATHIATNMKLSEKGPEDAELSGQQGLPMENPE